MRPKKVFYAILSLVFLAGSLYLILFGIESMAKLSNPAEMFAYAVWAEILPLIVIVFCLDYLRKFIPKSKPRIVPRVPQKWPETRSKKGHKHVSKKSDIWIDEPQETQGQFLKRLGVKREKRKPVPIEMTIPFETEVPKDDMKLKTLRARCQFFIDELERTGEISIGRHQHWGKLRGRDAVRFLYRDLRTLGYKNIELIMGDYDGKIIRKTNFL